MNITSHQNSHYKRLTSLATSKGVKQSGECLVSGGKITREYLKKNLHLDFYWIKTEKMQLPPGAWNQTLVFTNELFKDIDLLGTHSPILVSKVPPVHSMEEFDPTQPALFCATGDPANMGAILRSSLAFGLHQVVLLSECSHPFLPKSIRSSSGYAFDLKYFKGPSIKNLQDYNSLVALDMGGTDIAKAKLTDNLHFLIGEEGKGIPENFSGQKISIPMDLKVESLNATVAASLLLYEWNKRRK